MRFKVTRKRPIGQTRTIIHCGPWYIRVPLCSSTHTDTFVSLRRSLSLEWTSSNMSEFKKERKIIHVNRNKITEIKRWLKKYLSLKFSVFKPLMKSV